MLISPSCEMGCHRFLFPEESILNMPRMVLGYLFTISHPNLSTLEQTWQHDDSQQLCSRGLERSPPVPDNAVLSTDRGATGKNKHTPTPTPTPRRSIYLIYLLLPYHIKCPHATIVPSLFIAFKCIPYSVHIVR